MHSIYYSAIAPTYNALNAAIALGGPRCFLAQRIASLFETMAIAADIGELVEQFDNYHKDKPSEVKNRNWYLVMAAGVGFGTLAGLVACLGITRFRAPKGNLTELLVKGLELSPEAARQIQVSWQVPLLDRILLVPKVFRLGINLGILTFSKDKKPAILNFGLQAFTLFQMAGIPRVMMELPLSIQGVRTVKEAHTEIYAVIPPSKGCSSHLEKSLKGIYKYAQNLFTNSRWNFGQDILVRNGVPIDRKPMYEVTVKEPLRTVCECNQDFYVDAISGWTINTFYKVKAGFRVLIS